MNVPSAGALFKKILGATWGELHRDIRARFALACCRPPSAGQRVTVLSRQPRQAAWLFDGRVDRVSAMAQLPPSRRFDVVINLAVARILGWRWTAARRAASGYWCESRIIRIDLHLP